MRWLLLPFLIGFALMLWGLAGMADAGEVILRMDDAKLHSYIQQFCQHRNCLALTEEQQWQVAADFVVPFITLNRFDNLTHMGGTLEVHYDTPREP